MGEKKPDVTLSDGREIVFDLTKISMREYRHLFEDGQAAEEGDEMIGRCCGMTADEVANLSYLDYRRFVTAFFKTAREPLADPL